MAITITKDGQTIELSDAEIMVLASQVMGQQPVVEAGKEVSIESPDMEDGKVYGATIELEAGPSAAEVALEGALDDSFGLQVSDLPADMQESLATQVDRAVADALAANPNLVENECAELAAQRVVRANRVGLKKIAAALQRESARAAIVPKMEAHLANLFGISPADVPSKVWDRHVNLVVDGMVNANKILGANEYSAEALDGLAKTEVMTGAPVFALAGHFKREFDVPLSKAPAAVAERLVSNVKNTFESIKRSVTGAFDVLAAAARAAEAVIDENWVELDNLASDIKRSQKIDRARTASAAIADAKGKGGMPPRTETEH